MSLKSNSSRLACAMNWIFDWLLYTQSNQGTTPLLHAVEGGWMRIIKFLVEKGADIEKSKPKSWRPLHMGMYRQWSFYSTAHLDIDANGIFIAVYKGYHDVAQFLVERGAMMNVQIFDVNLKGYTPLRILNDSKSGWSRFHICDRWHFHFGSQLWP